MSPKEPTRLERWERLLCDRLGEPLHLNLLSIPVRLFGGYRAKVAFDLIERRRYAFAVLKAADYAADLGLRKIYVLEFGVAAGAGLANLAWLAKQTTEVTGVAIEIVGFDAGTGMPRPRDYRDYPEEFIEGDFPLPDRAALEKNLPKEVRVVYGPVAETARGFVDGVDAPVGFISFDLAYYSSTVEAMAVLEGPADHYLPITPVYLGAVRMDNANPAVGELLAAAEFNRDHPMRQVHPFTALREKRIFRRGEWLNQIYALHVLDHPRRSGQSALGRDVWVLGNPYEKALTS